MTIRILFISLIALTGLRCNHSEISLGKVSDLPEYFFASFRFGRDIRSIEQLNEFILVTGKIDTTSESPPVHLAVVVIGQHKLFLHLHHAEGENGETNESYSGEGYDLELKYKEKHIPNHSPIYEGYFVIRQNNNSTQYEVVGTSGL